MDEFFIGDTNFGVEREESRFDLEKAADGHLLLMIEIRGDKKVYNELTADDDSEWSWTLYPPYFYLLGYPIPAKPNGNDLAIKVMPEDSDEVDLALYLMEHCDVEGVTINIRADRIEVFGRVDLFGKRHEIRIKWMR